MIELILAILCVLPLQNDCKIFEQTPPYTWENSTYVAELYEYPSVDRMQLRVVKDDESVWRETSSTLRISPFGIFGAQPQWLLFNQRSGLQPYPMLTYCIDECNHLRFISIFDGQLGELAEWWTDFVGDTVRWHGNLYGIGTYTNDGFDYLVIYEEVDGIVRLITNDVMRETEIYADSFYLAGLPDTDIGKWYDYNADGLLEFAVMYSHDGTGRCYQGSLLLLQLQRDGTFTTLDMPSCATWLVDANGDGVAEIGHVIWYDLAINQYLSDNILGTTPYEYLSASNELYAWDGTAYSLAEQADYADYLIDNQQAHFEDEFFPLSWDDVVSLEKLVITYQRVRREDEGLQLLDRYSNPTCFTDIDDTQVYLDLATAIRSDYGLSTDEYPACENPFQTPVD